MRQSALFTKTRKEAPADEVSKNAQLLIRGGFVFKEISGVYSYLPLGLRVLNKIVQVIREEMNAIGGQEIVMTALQDKALWEKTDRWDDAKVDNWFKTAFVTGGETGLGITHEEPVTRIMTEHISSYRDLPAYVYQFQNKFRNETRAKSGLIRGKEFMMKDLYSFSSSEEQHKAFFDSARAAYNKIFARVGVGEITYVTSASGGIFSSGFSEEFQTLSDAGEDTVLVNEKAKIAINIEVADEALQKLGMQRSDFEERKAIESGNIFNLGNKFSEPLGLRFMNEAGVSTPVIMGCYGLGPTRLMGTLVEVLSDAKGMVWPDSVAPFAVHLVELSQGNEEIKKMADGVYEELAKAGVEVLYDDRDARAGEKFADSDLMGIPYRIVIGKQSTSDSIEVVRRKDGSVTKVSRDAILKGAWHF